MPGKILTSPGQGVASMPKSSFKYFVEIPLLLAEGTLKAIENGVGKLSREQVMQIVGTAIINAEFPVPAGWLDGVLCNIINIDNSPNNN